MAGRINSLYLLTEMTGKQANTGRTAVIGTFEVKWRNLIIFLIALVPGMIITSIFFGLLGSIAVLWVPIVQIGAFWLFAKRQRDGLKLHTWKAVLDKKNAKTHRFTLCGQVLDLDSLPVTRIVSASAPVPDEIKQRQAEQQNMDFGSISF